MLLLNILDISNKILNLTLFVIAVNQPSNSNIYIVNKSLTLQHIKLFNIFDTPN